jgi:uncharacterized membrane protein
MQKMDLDTVAKIVIIIGGISQVIRVWQQIIIDRGKNNTNTTAIPISVPSEPKPIATIITNLIVAIGVVLFLYGGFNAASAIIKINVSREGCIQGYDPGYQNIIRVCNDFANSKYQKELNFGLIGIGASFVLASITLLIQKIKTASTIQFILAFIWLTLGGWLIISNL